MKHSKRKCKLSRHHVVPRSRGGKNADWNILYLTEDHHRIWHRLFGNRTIPEVIGLLKRIQSLKSFKG